MKFCQRCANQIVESTKLRIIPDAKPFGLVFEPQVVVPESECEFWAHRQMNVSAANLNEVIDRAFHDEGKAVVEVAKLREIWRGLGGAR